MTVQIFIPTSELALPTGTPAIEVNAEIETTDSRNENKEMFKVI